MQHMPPENPLIQLVKILYCINLLFSYPLCIYPTNMIIDSHLFKWLEEGSERRLIYENISHSLVLLLALLSALFFYQYLDKILAVIGTVCGLTVVLIIPSICHYKLIATDKIVGSKFAKYTDIGISCYAVVALVVCFTQLISNWNNE